MTEIDDYFEVLLVHRVTKVDQLRKCVAVDKELIPKHGLPIWTTMTLAEKLPLPPFIPSSLVRFSRGKIGKKLWKSTPGQDFNLDDPYMYEVDFTYEPLHDPHLRNFFSNPVIRNRAIELELIDKNGRAFCTLEGFNRFRRYNNRVQSDLIAKERKKWDLIDKNKRIMNKIVHENNVRNYEWKIRSDKAKRRVIDRVRAFQEKTSNQVKEKKKKIEKFLQERKEKWESILECAKIRDQSIKDRIIMKQNLQRTRLISTLEKLYHDALERDIKREEQIFEKYRERQYKKQEYWQRKIKFQELYFDKQDSIKKLIETQTAKEIEKREKKWNAELLKMKVQLDEIKYIMSHPKLRRELELRKEKLNAAIEAKQKLEKKKAKESGKYSIMKQKDPEEFKEMQFSDTIPLPVQVVIKYLCSSVLHNFVVKALTSVLHDLPNIIIDKCKKMVHLYYNQRNKPFRWVCVKTEKRWPKCKHVCIVENESDDEANIVQEPKRSLTSLYSNDQRKTIQAKMDQYDMETKRLKGNGADKRNASSVNFGHHSLIGILDVTDPLQLRDVKKRIPTPVPSIVQLVDSLQTDGENGEEMMIYDDKIDMRILINQDVVKFRRWVGNQMIIRSQKAIEDNSRIMYKYELRDLTSTELIDRLADKFLASNYATIIESSLADQLCDVLVREMFKKLNEMRNQDMIQRQLLSNKKNSSVMSLELKSDEDFEEMGPSEQQKHKKGIKFFDPNQNPEEPSTPEIQIQSMNKKDLFDALNKFRSSQMTVSTTNLNFYKLEDANKQLEDDADSIEENDSDLEDL